MLLLAIIRMFGVSGLAEIVSLKNKFWKMILNPLILDQRLHFMLVPNEIYISEEGRLSSLYSNIGQVQGKISFI